MGGRDRRPGASLALPLTPVVGLHNSGRSHATFIGSRLPKRNVAPTNTVAIASTPAGKAIQVAPIIPRTTAARNVIRATAPGALTSNELRGPRVAAATIPDTKSKTPNT